MLRLPRPRTDCQRRASIGLVNIFFLMLVTWLLSGALPPGIDSTSTSSLVAENLPR